MSEKGLAARIRAGARSLITSRRRASPAAPQRTVADLVRARGDTEPDAAPPTHSAPGAEARRTDRIELPGASVAERPTERIELPVDPDDDATPPTGIRAVPGDDAPGNVREPAMTGLLAAPPPMEPAEDAATPAGAPTGAGHVDAPDDPDHRQPGPEAGGPDGGPPAHARAATDRIVVPPEAGGESLAPPWVRAALMGNEPGGPATEQTAAGRALRRTFGLSRDPRPLALAGTDTAVAVRPAGTRARPVTVVVRPLAAGYPVPVRFRVAARGGDPLPAVTVTLLDSQGATVTSAVSDVAGRGRILAPHPDCYVLVAAAPGHQPGAMAIGPEAAPGEVELLLGRSAAVVGALRVDGEAVAGAQLTLVQDGEIVETVVTDTAGRFRLADLGGGTYALAVSANACTPTVVELVVPQARELVYDIDLAGS